jgi:hypothetical protein
MRRAFLASELCGNVSRSSRLTGSSSQVCGWRVGGVPSTAINAELLCVYVTRITYSYGALFQILVPTHSSGCDFLAAS